MLEINGRVYYSLVILISFILFMSIGNAADLGTFKAGDCVTLRQSCADCSFVNISSIIYPNSTQATGQVAMVKSGVDYTYNFCNTSSFGIYSYTTFGDPNGTLITQPVTFEINPQGKIYSTTTGLIYLGIIIILILIFGLFTYLFFIIPYDNQRTELGNVININYRKYLKIFMFALTYLSFVAINYFAWNLSYGILDFPELSNFFQYLFRISLVLIIPMFIVVVIMGTVNIIRDKNTVEGLKRNLTMK
jgi:hypothetical protein